MCPMSLFACRGFEDATRLKPLIRELRQMPYLRKNKGRSQHESHHHQKRKSEEASSIIVFKARVIAATSQKPAAFWPSTVGVFM